MYIYVTVNALGLRPRLVFCTFVIILFPSALLVGLGASASNGKNINTLDALGLRPRHAKEYLLLFISLGLPPRLLMYCNVVMFIVN